MIDAERPGRSDRSHRAEGAHDLDASVTAGGWGEEEERTGEAAWSPARMVVWKGDGRGSRCRIWNSRVTRSYCQEALCTLICTILLTYRPPALSPGTTSLAMPSPTLGSVNSWRCPFLSS